MRYSTYMRKLALSLFLLVAINAFAANSVVVPPCTPIELKTSGNNIVLPGPEEKHTAQLYFFKNNSTQSVWLDHPVAHASASAGWSSYLRAGNWAALILNRKNFTVSCSVISPGKVDELACAKTVTVCLAKTGTNVVNQKNTYWLAEDESWDDLVKAMAKRGVHL